MWSVATSVLCVLSFLNVRFQTPVLVVVIVLVGVKCSLTVRGLEANNPTTTWKLLNFLIYGLIKMFRAQFYPKYILCNNLHTSQAGLSHSVWPCRQLHAPKIPVQPFPQPSRGSGFTNLHPVVPRSTAHLIAAAEGKRRRVTKRTFDGLKQKTRGRSRLL